MSGGANTPLGELPGNPHAGEHGARSCGHPVEFSAPAKEAFDRLLPRYPTKQAALLPTLWLAQNEFGWISREVVDYVATLLSLSPAFVWGVVTFYTMFNRAPVGRHLIQFCTSISCHLRGAEEVYAACRKKLGNLKPGETTPDGKYTVVEVECLALCDKAPAVQVNEGDFFFVTPDKIDEFLKGLR
jgi:NADH-quinone oxidoreductase E subunit